MTGKLPQSRFVNGFIQMLRLIIQVALAIWPVLAGDSSTCADEALEISVLPGF